MLASDKLGFRLKCFKKKSSLNCDKKNASSERHTQALVEPETSSTDVREKATMSTGSTEAVSTIRKRLCEPKNVFVKVFLFERCFIQEDASGKKKQNTLQIS